ncbi:hypothetical protein E2C01_000191 [Portunus trituberculatus]|uniref:Uncharacterized protein n=1 Tax=Portunus trituberculatus TaxID=210409 RepID=A0A5B7CEI0_PORTR|nr:hypothetical protein [Portunus trituberculatus]
MSTGLDAVISYSTTAGLGRGGRGADWAWLPDNHAFLPWFYTLTPLPVATSSQLSRGASFFLFQSNSQQRTSSPCGSHEFCTFPLCFSRQPSKDPHSNPRWCMAKIRHRCGEAGQGQVCWGTCRQELHRPASEVVR